MEFDVEYFARLARIKLTEEEKIRFAKELGIFWPTSRNSRRWILKILPR